MSSLFLSRLSHLRRLMQSHSLSGFIVSKKENIHYLTGLHQIHPSHREALLFITPSSALLYHSLFLNPPNFPHLTHVPMSPSAPLKSALSQAFPEILPDPVGLEGDNLTVNEWQNISNNLTASIQPTLGLIEELRKRKDASEMKKIRQASVITSQVMSEVITFLNTKEAEGITEKDLSIRIERSLVDRYADGLAFPVIVAFDAHTALPHHQPGNTKLSPQSIVLFDFGCEVDGYTSDMTRTVKRGKPDPVFTRIETNVQNAYQAALSILKTQFQVRELTNDVAGDLESTPRIDSSLMAADIDHAARSVIESAGFGPNFIHTTGHSLGLEIHEQPSINSQNQEKLVPGMVITLEPGIYLPHQFGYRYENTLALESR